MKTAFVATVGDFPTHSATTLAAAQDAAAQDETEFRSSERYEYRWDEHRAGQIWRLMSRADTGGRFRWTSRAVHAVPHIPA